MTGASGAKEGPKFLSFGKKLLNFSSNQHFQKLVSMSSFIIFEVIM